MKKNSVCIIIYNFTKIPEHFDLFLKSCEYNPEIHFLLVTDLAVTHMPENIKVVLFSMGDLQRRAERVLGTTVKLSNFYKPCDLRPMFGEIFREELQAYDYWGHADHDIVLGNVSFFLSPLIKQGYDIINCYPNWCSSPFCIYRNIPKCNSLFRDSNDWREMLNTERYCNFDEIAGFYFDKLNQGVPPEEIDSPFTSNTQLIWRVAKAGKVKLYHERLIHDAWRTGKELCHFTPGGITMGSDAIFLHHFIFDKSRSCFSFPHWKTVPDEFYFDRTGFYTTDMIKHRGVIIVLRYLLSPKKFFQRVLKSVERHGFYGFFKRCLKRFSCTLF